jgi:hypothetical protein
MSIFTEYISVEVNNQTPKNKLDTYLISGGTGWKSTSADFLLFSKKGKKLKIWDMVCI